MTDEKLKPCPFCGEPRNKMRPQPQFVEIGADPKPVPIVRSKNGTLPDNFELCCQCKRIDKPAPGEAD